VLGTGQAGCSLSESIIVLQGLIAIACTWIAFRRAKALPRCFGFCSASCWWSWLFPQSCKSSARCRATPLAGTDARTALRPLWRSGSDDALPSRHPLAHSRKFEIFLDLLQVAIVVGLIYSAFFFVPCVMLPADAMTRDVSISDAQSLLLLIAAFIRLQFVRAGRNRSLLIRLGLFLMICAVATFIGDWLYLKNDPGIAAWIDLLWSIPQAAAALIAITWRLRPIPLPLPLPSRPVFVFSASTWFWLPCFPASLCSWIDGNKHRSNAHGRGDRRLAPLVHLRLALTQFHQQQEIASVSGAAAGNGFARGSRPPVDDSRRQTAEITQISELEACFTPAHPRRSCFALFRSVAALFPGHRLHRILSAPRTTSNRSLNGAFVRQTGSSRPSNVGRCDGERFMCTPEDTRNRGALTAWRKVLRCAFPHRERRAIGTLSIQDNGLMHPGPDPEFDSNALARRRHLAAAVAEHLSLAVANSAS